MDDRATPEPRQCADRGRSLPRLFPQTHRGSPHCCRTSPQLATNQSICAHLGAEYKSCGTRQC
eukprot:6644877-Prymnesium_polylepis.3